MRIPPSTVGRRDGEQWRWVPIATLTSSSLRAETRPGLKIQGHPFLAKPISIPELVAGIERSLPAQAAS